jgi:hypothetical protein
MQEIGGRNIRSLLGILDDDNSFRSRGRQLSHCNAVSMEVFV